MAYHSIYKVDFTASTMWYKTLSDVSITISLGIPVGKQVSTKVEFLASGAEEYETIFSDEFNTSTSRKALIDYKKFAIGTNKVKITTTDEVPAEDDENNGQLVYEHDIVVENRDSSEINRCYDFASEYLISGSGTIDNNNQFTVSTDAGFKTAIVVPRKAIEMDGRSLIRTITVNGDDDTVGVCETNVTTTNQEDMGDSYMQTIPFSDIMTFKTLSKIQAIDATNK